MKKTHLKPAHLFLAVVFISVQSMPGMTQDTGHFNYRDEVFKLAFVTNNIPIGWADSCQKFIDGMTDNAQNTFFYSFYDQRIIPVTVNENTPRKFINRFYTAERLEEFESLTGGDWRKWKEALKKMYRVKL